MMNKIKEYIEFYKDYKEDINYIILLVSGIILLAMFFMLNNFFLLILYAIKLLAINNAIKIQKKKRLKTDGN